MAMDYQKAKDRRGATKSMLKRPGYATGGIAFPATQFKTSQPPDAPFSRARYMTAAAAADSAAAADGSETQRTK